LKVVKQIKANRNTNFKTQLMTQKTIANGNSFTTHINQQQQQGQPKPNPAKQQQQPTVMPSCASLPTCNLGTEVIPTTNS